MRNWKMTQARPNLPAQPKLLISELQTRSCEYRCRLVLYWAEVVWIVRTVMPHVFISYVRENGDVVDRLASELKSRGVTVWLDRNDIEPGARWRDAIKNAILGGKFFLACFSREFNDRDRSYMNEELTLAIDELRERPSSRTWFVPVLINETAIPSRRISSVERLSDIHALRLYDNWRDGIERILRVIKYDDPVSARIYSLVDALQRPFRDERLFALQ
jgi:hypothetical protein